MSSSDKAVLLKALGWSRDGKASYRDRESQDRDQTTHLPDDVVRIISEFTFFDIRSEAYREHILKEKIKSRKLHVLDYILYEFNYGLRRCETGEYGVDYTPINIGNKCCTICGEFVPVWGDPNPENIRCSCRFGFISDEKIMEMELEREDNYFWDEEIDKEREKERRRKNREEFGDNWWCDCDSDFSYEDYDDDYSDRPINWDGE